MDDGWLKLRLPSLPTTLAKRGLKSSKNAIFQIANLTLIICVCAQMASGERGAVVVLENNAFDGGDGDVVVVDEIQGHFAGVGLKPQEERSGKLRTVSDYRNIVIYTPVHHLLAVT